ncbi:MAG TPA: substrate-binding domain-containing protein, partial [Terrimesophilobacter sp.]|nr:substrate-binding domain-containing protein [Terrimesophilobacter sp.]
QAANVLLSRSTGATAVFIATGNQAVGALRAFSEAGLRVPDDLAIVSFDGTQETEFANPSLTAIRPPLELVASTAVELLLDAGSRAAGIHRLIPHEILLRESCGPHE